MSRIPIAANILADTPRVLHDRLVKVRPSETPTARLDENAEMRTPSTAAGGNLS